MCVVMGNPTVVLQEISHELGKLPMQRVIGMMLNLPRKSLALELKEFFEVLSPQEEVSKSAYSQARYKLKHEFFEDWNDLLTKNYYTDNDERVKKWKGFVLMAVDGSTLHLFEDELGEIAKHFGKYRGAVTARVMCMYDVLNALSYKSHLAPITTSENEIARNWLSELSEDKAFLDEVLCIYDMKFIGFAAAYEHVNQGINFLMRAERNFNTLVHNFARSGKKQKIEKWYPSKEGLKELQSKGYTVTEQDYILVRLVRVDLPNGEIEYLVTSLTDLKKYPRKDFGPLYF